jgi:hypothetical protein
MAASSDVRKSLLFLYKSRQYSIFLKNSSWSEYDFSIFSFDESSSLEFIEYAIMKMVIMQAKCPKLIDYFFEIFFLFCEDLGIDDVSPIIPCEGVTIGPALPIDIARR